MPKQEAGNETTHKLPIAGTEENRADWESLGFVFKDIPADELGQLFNKYVEVTLPKDWKIEDSSCPGYQDIIDHLGRKRGEIVLNGLVYARLRPRYVINKFAWSHDDNLHTVKVIVHDETNLEQPFYSVAEQGTSKLSDRKRIRDRLVEQTTAWLNQYCPDWQNPLAYWN